MCYFCARRYLTVCHPFFAFSHKWTSNWYISTIVSFSVVYNLPKFFELQTGVVARNLTLEEEGWSANMSGEEEDLEFIYRIDPTEMRINEYYIKVRREAMGMPRLEIGYMDMHSKTVVACFLRFYPRSITIHSAPKATGTLCLTFRVKVHSRLHHRVGKSSYALLSKVNGAKRRLIHFFLLA